MHVLDAADSAGGLYTAGPPRTLLGRHYLNAVGREIIGAIEAAEITLRVSGAADAAASYTGQLRDAIRRLSRKLELGTHDMLSSSETLTPNYDLFVYHITENSSLPYAELTIDSDPQYANGLLVIYNSTPSAKVLINWDGSPISILAPGQAVEIYAFSDSGDIFWAPTSGVRSGIFEVEMRGSVDGEIDSGVATFRVGNGLVEVNIPALGDTLSTAQNLSITGAGGGGFPAITDWAAGEGKRACCIINNNVESVGMVYYSGSAGSRILNVLTGVGFPGTSFSGISGVNGISMLYKAA